MHGSSFHLKLPYSKSTELFQVKFHFKIKFRSHSITNFKQLAFITKIFSPIYCLKKINLAANKKQHVRVVRYTIFGSVEEWKAWQKVGLISENKLQRELTFIKTWNKFVD